MGLGLVLGNPRLGAVIFAVAAIMMYGIILSHVLPVHRHFLVNVLISLLTIVCGLLAGLSLDDMGLSAGDLVAGLPLTLAIVGLVFVGAYLSRHIPLARKAMRKSHWVEASGREIAYAAGARIPLSTVLLEEVLFRGLMLGLLLREFVPLLAVIVSSVMFGLWHISPMVARLESDDHEDCALPSRRHVWNVAATVVATAAAGFFFGLLRLWTGSLLAPWLVHWAINTSGIFASVSAGRSPHSDT